MGNYSLVVGSKYSPFTFQELLQPALMATQAHQQLEDQYSELATKAGMWENLANEQADPDTYNMYKKYSDDLAMQAEQLAREGLNPLSRQNMLNMKRRYSNEIVPIENAYNRRQALIDEQRKLSTADGTMMYDVDASTLSLDDLIRNPQISYKSLSGDLLRKQVGVAAKNLAQSMRENPRYWRSILNDQYYETMMQSGFKPSEVLNTLRALADKNPAVNNELTKIVEDVVNSSGVKNWGSQDIIKRAYQYAGEGLWEAVGKTDYQMQANRAFGMDIPSSNGRGRGNENVSPFIMEKYKMGTHGKYDDSLKQFEGLRPTEYGFSTNELDKVNLTGIMKKAGRTPDNYFFRRLNEIENMDFDSEEYNKAMLSLANDYKFKDIKEINNALAQRKEIIDRYKKEAEKYSHLGNTPLEQIDMGTRLAKMQQTEGSYAYGITGKESSLKNVKNAFREGANLYSTEEFENNPDLGLFKLDKNSSGDIKKENKLSKKELDTVLENIDKSTIKVRKDSNGIYMGFTLDGEDYIFKGSERLDNFKNITTTVDSYLKDFSKDGVIDAVEIDNDTYYNISQNNYSKLPKLKPIYLKNGFKGYVLKAPDGNYIKIMTDSNNIPIAINTLSSELSGGGMRAEAVENMISKGLESFENSYN